jgi:hypothetical protein
MQYIAHKALSYFSKILRTYEFKMAKCFVATATKRSIT